MRHLKVKSFRAFLLSGFAVLAVCGFFYILNELNQKRRVASDDLVEESIFNVASDLTAYKGSALQKRIKYRLFEKARWVSDQSNHHLILGNLKLKDAEGQVVNLCEEFPLLELVFQADGIVVSGDAPKIIVRSSCSAKADAEFLNPVSIPWQTIQNLDPIVTKEYKSSTSTLYFRSIDDFWPLEWTLLEMKLYSKKSKVPMQITGYDVITIRNFPLNFLLNSQVQESQ